MDVTSKKPNSKPEPKYAAALRYRPGQDQAPIVIASGKGKVAETILKLAEEAGVPNHIEPGLAKILANLEPGTPIPEETYRLVASILAFIWRLDKQYTTGPSGTGGSK